MERRKHAAKLDRRNDEIEKERAGWAQMYEAMQQEIDALRQGEAPSFRVVASPPQINSTRLPSEGVFGSRADSEVNEQLKTKEEEIKILWNVIKEINKSKGSEKVSVEQLQQVITSSRTQSF